MRCNVSVIHPNDNADNYGNFMVSDIIGALKEMQYHNCKVVLISSYEGSQEEKHKSISEVIELVKKYSVFDTEIVICTTAYVSKDEFPEVTWQISKENAEKENKKLIPTDKILQRESKLLEDLNFIDINEFIDYEYKKAYIYNNYLGQKVKQQFMK